MVWACRGSARTAPHSGPSWKSGQPGELSRIERQDDLKRYIEALGGRLEVRAIFGDEHVVLLGGDGRGEP